MIRVNLYFVNQCPDHFCCQLRIFVTFYQRTQEMIFLTRLIVYYPEFFRNVCSLLLVRNNLFIILLLHLPKAISIHLTHPVF